MGHDHLEKIAQELISSGKARETGFKSADMICLSTQGSAAAALWRELHQKASSLLLSPLIIGTATEASRMLDELDERVSYSGRPEKIIEAAESIDLKAWFQERENEYAESMAELEKEAGSQESGRGLLDGFFGLFKKQSCEQDLRLKEYDFLSVKDVLKLLYHKEVYFLLLPTPRSFEAAAYLAYGDWNECPSAAIHLALAKYWHEKWSAEVFAITSDVVEFSVERPPMTYEQALELAKEHYLFCPDTVEQGVETIPALARALERTKGWFFWWD